MKKIALNDKVIMVIPSLEPDLKLIAFLDEFFKRQENEANSPIAQVIVVNDGSSEEYDGFFKTCIDKFNCIVLTHAVNLGKGRALKTAINYIMNSYSGFLGMITVDADGQHGVEDIFNCCDAFLAQPEKLVLGCRNFGQQDVPLKSSLGNRITRQVFRSVSGVYVSDTQTGLRVIPKKFLPALLSLKGERFEYELNMLIEAKENDTEIYEVGIKTIYIEENRSSHFRPFADSARVYSVFIKFILSSTSSFLVDILIFMLVKALFNIVGVVNDDITIPIATAVARLASSLLNYATNKKVVFKSGAGKETLVKYYILAIIQMSTSAALVVLVNKLSVVSINIEGIKIIIDMLLFFISFPIQRAWVFKKSNKKI